MDDKTKKTGGTKRTESSLLLQPSSLSTWETISGPMPVVVRSAEESGMKSETQNLEQQPKALSKEARSYFLPPVTVEQQTSSTGSISQLQQPLMVRKTTPQTESPVPSTSSGLSVHEHLKQTASVEGAKFSAGGDVGISKAPHLETYSFSGPTSLPVSQADKTDFNTAGAAHNELHAAAEGDSETADYPERFVVSHWFYQNFVENREVWYGFSLLDSSEIEEAYQKELMESTPTELVIPVIGGRYDVLLKQRIKKAVYWEENICQVRRCTWFNKVEGSQYYVPYDEEFSKLLEEHYQRCLTLDRWQQRVLINREVVMFENPYSICHYTSDGSSWPPSDSKLSTRFVKRGVPEDAFILPDETKEVGHLVFIVQGIGAVCDLRFRSVSECVDGFREIANRLITVHFKHEFESKQIHRVEFLPVAWHSSLHNKEVGLDRLMQSITLPSIPKLRHFTNDTLLDILLYSSPLYCQAIVNTVSEDLNNLYQLFLKRNPEFTGRVSVAGHSLGSLILFDILSHQPSNKLPKSVDRHDTSSFTHNRQSELTDNTVTKRKASSITVLFKELDMEEYIEPFLTEKMDVESLVFCDEDELKALGLPMGPRKKLISYLKNFATEIDPVEDCEETASDSVSASSSNTEQTSGCVYPGNLAHTALFSVTFPRLDFSPACFFALGSPISMFLAVRGFSTIRKDFEFPTCSSFFHIFHPYDPVAFRIEPLIEPGFTQSPVLIPHHKGRKRMHLEIRENMSRFGAELKQKLLDTLRYTWGHLNVFSRGNREVPEAFEAEVDKIVMEEMSATNENITDGLGDATSTGTEAGEENIPIGRLNGGRRIDYVLQEKPIEALNEYIFALSSHATYWNSEDTALMILKEVYCTDGIVPSQNSAETGADIKTTAESHSAIPPCSAQPFEIFYNYPTVAEGISYDQKLPSSLEIPDAHQTCTEISDIKLSNSLDVESNGSSASSVLSPPPLSGFVKKSPFSKKSSQMSMQ